MGNGFFQHNFGLWQITIFLKSKTKQSIYFFLSLLKICYTENLKKNLLLSVFGGILLGLSWPTYGFSFLIFFALIPFIYVAENINADDNKRKGLRVFSTTYIGFFIWNLISTWWIYNSTAFGAAFALICNSSFYAIILTTYRWALTRLPRKTSLLLLVAFWIAFEKFHLNWDFSWPWLNLGNVFSENILWIQWYEFTGVFGGTLWILIVNLIGLKYFKHYQEDRRLIEALRGYAPTILWIAFPIAISLLLFQKEIKPTGTANVVLLQPNLDPYEEKYQLTNIDLLGLAKKLTQNKILPTTDYLLTPEGYFDEGYGLNLRQYNTTKLYDSLNEFKNKFPNLSLVTGAQSFKLYPPSEKSPSPTANKLRIGWYDVYNSVFQFQANKKDQLYHKSKLVVGVEYMPYKNFFEPLIGEFMLDFGGTVATRGIQNTRTVFEHAEGYKTAPIVCYESIYGEYVTEYVRNGAQFLSIITNDAWWGNTQGHKQLLSYARLRAIENRRAIARSANTGISAFINAKGRIEQTLAYEEQDALPGKVNLHDKLTFYSIYGDYLARWAIFIFVLLLLIALSGRLKEKTVF